MLVADMTLSSLGLGLGLKCRDGAKPDSWPGWGLHPDLGEAPWPDQLHTPAITKHRR